ncbi:MAG TPA: molybdopterin-dependent oxidoreductase [Chloroflexota bacterium]|nr:molybdopterin-dependent oxidoreductase [Chloroflexota bacterium]
MAAKQSGRLHISWAAAVLGSLVGSGLVMLLMLAARSAFQIRTLPERLMETFLLVIPPDQFEAAIEKYGPMAKDFALIGANLVMFVALFAIGLLAIRRFRSSAALLLLGVALWLVAGVVIFPVTSGGLFATGLLLQSPILTNAVYTGIGLIYASSLIAGRWLFSLAGQPAPAPGGMSALETRRSFIAGLAGSAVALVVSVWFGRSAGKVSSALPAATIGEPDVASPPATTPAAGSGPISAAASPSTPAAGSSSPAPSATANPYPEPPPARPLARDKDGALLAVNRPRGQLQTAITANDDFYTVTKNAGGDPQLNAQDWRLIIDGAVNKPVQLDYLTLRKLPQVKYYKTLECISNLTAKCELTAFGCDLLSTAEWTGARLTDVLNLAGGLKPGVVALAAIGADEFSSALPVEAANDPNVLLAYEMNGTVLPREHGFPVRVIIPGRYGVKNAKWIVKLQPMTQPYVDWYGQRNWSQTAIVRTMSRIDEPLNGALVPAGMTRVAGVAYAADRGVAKVELSPDGGRTWQPATFVEAPLGKDTFVRWQSTVQLAAGQPASLVVRATDGTGQLQPETFNLPQPNGGSGWHSIDVKVAAA